MTPGRPLRDADREAEPPFHRLDFSAEPWLAEDLEAVREHLEAGGLIAYPTETVYGFGCALDSGALRRLAQIKRRKPSSPFLLLLPEGGTEGLRWSASARALAAKFWPGALTLVLEDPDLRFPPEVRGEGGVAVRRSGHPLARAIPDRLGTPLTSTSANLLGAAPSRSADEAARAAGRAGAGAEEMWILDGGPLPDSPPSTLVDCTGGKVEVLRAGAIPAERIAGVRTGES